MVLIRSAQTVVIVEPGRCLLVSQVVVRTETPGNRVLRNGGVETYQLIY